MNLRPPILTRSYTLLPYTTLCRASRPAFASGLKVAAAVAPIGAVIGEWVGASAGLGFLMLQANARVQTDLMFAALIVLAACAIALYTLVDLLSRRLLPWQADSHADRKSTRLNSSHYCSSRMPSSAC